MSTFANKLEICNYLSRADFSFHNYSGADNPVFKISEEILDCLGEVDLDSLSYEELCSIDAPYYVLYRAAEAANDKEKLAYYSEKVKYFEEKRKAREEE